MKKNLHQRVSTGLLALMILLGGCPEALAAEAGEAFQEGAEALSDWTSPPDRADVAADWKFDQTHSTGSIAGGDLVLEDQSGNGNDLKMQVYNGGNQEEYILSLIHI